MSKSAGNGAMEDNSSGPGSIRRITNEPGQGCGCAGCFANLMFAMVMICGLSLLAISLLGIKIPDWIMIDGKNSLHQISEAVKNNLPQIKIPWDTSDSEQTPAFQASNVKSLKITPVAGITINAPHGALDKERSFKVTPFAESKTEELFRKNIADGNHVLMGFDFDAGMAENDRFSAPVQFTFDLKTLGFPQHVWKYINPARADKDGKIALLRSTLKGSELSIQTRHNNPIVLAGVPIVILGLGYLAHDDLKVLPTVSKGENKWITMKWPPIGSQFIIKYPKDWSPADPAKFEEARKELHDLEKKYDKKYKQNSPLRSWLYEKFVGVLAEPDVQQVLEKYSKREWLLNVGLPKKVGLTAIAMERSVDYLEKRDFRKPGWGGFEWLTWVYLLDKALGSDCYGNAVNPKLTRGYIEIDGTKIPDKKLSELGEDTDEKSCFDALQTTAVHEYFHIVQSAYITIDWNSYLWFFEASARVLEAEAGKYFVGQGYAKEKSWNHTLRRHDVFCNQMDLRKGTAAELQQHGYGQSYFLEFIRDNFYKNNPDEYSKKLLNDFGAWNSSSIKAIQSSSGLDKKKFADEFERFAKSLYPDIIADSATTIARLTPFGTNITGNNPRAALANSEPAPLSVRGLRLTIKGKSFNKLDKKNSLLVFRDTTAHYGPLKNEWRFLSKGAVNWQKFPEEGKLFTTGLPTAQSENMGIDILRTASSADGYQGYGCTEVYLVEPPDKAPVCSTAAGFLNIKIEPCILAGLAPPSNSEPYIHGHEIFIQSTAGGEKITLSPDVKTAQGGITHPLSDLQKRLKTDSNGQLKAKIWYRKIISRKQKIFTIESPETAINLDAKAERLYVNLSYPRPFPEIQFFIDGSRISGCRRGFFTKKSKQLTIETRVISGSFDEKTGIVSGIVEEKNLYRNNMQNPIHFRFSFKVADPNGPETKAAVCDPVKNSSLWSERKIKVLLDKKDDFFKKQAELNQKNAVNNLHTVWEFSDQ